jgi:hypothetical protein
MSGIFLVCTALIFWASRGSVLAVDDPTPDQSAGNQAEKPTRMTRSSGKTVVNDVVYGLEEERNRLYLTSQPLDGADRKVRRIELDFTIPEGGRVVEMSLARHSVRNLMAVLKIARGGEFDFHCLGLIAQRGEHVRDGFRFLQERFFTTKDDLKILAAEGTHFLGSVFIVLAEMDLNQEVMVTTGTFYFSGCPWTPGDGRLSPFRAESVAPKGE